MARSLNFSASNILERNRLSEHWSSSVEGRDHVAGDTFVLIESPTALVDLDIWPVKPLPPQGVLHQDVLDCLSAIHEHADSLNRLISFGVSHLTPSWRRYFRLLARRSAGMLWKFVAVDQFSARIVISGADGSARPGDVGELLAKCDDERVMIELAKVVRLRNSSLAFIRTSAHAEGVVGEELELSTDFWFSPGSPSDDVAYAGAMLQRVTDGKIWGLRGYGSLDEPSVSGVFRAIRISDIWSLGGYVVQLSDGRLEVGAVDPALLWI